MVKMAISGLLLHTRGVGDARTGLKCDKGHLRLIFACEGGGRYGSGTKMPWIHPRLATACTEGGNVVGVVESENHA